MENLYTKIITSLYNSLPKEKAVVPRCDMLRDYYNNKYPTSLVEYNGRVLPGSNTRFKIDVRDFFSLNDENLLNIIKSLKMTTMSDNQKALTCLKWIIQNIPYKSDTTNYKIGEFWCTPYETLKKGSADCFTGETKIIVRNKEGVVRNITFKELEGCWMDYEALSYDYENKKSVFRPITNFMAQGQRPVYEVTTRFGGKFKCTDNHKFLCRDSQKSKEFKWKELKDIDTEKWWKRATLSMGKMTEGNGKIDDDLACLIGSYVADGWTDKGRSSIAGDDEEIRKRLHRALNNLGINYSQSKRKVHAYTTILKKDLPEYVSSLLLSMGYKGKYKRFPDEVMSADNESIKRVLHYYGERDGTHYNGEVRVYSTVSDDLSGQIKLLLIRLGIHYSDYLQIQNRNDCNRLPIHRIDFRASGKINNDTEQNSIYSYSFAGVEETYDITVADTHNFILSDSRIIAHNCEDGAILLANMLIVAGVPNWKVRISAGYVFEPVSKQQVGHAYLTFFDEINEKWVILDWCYYPNLKQIEEREEYKKETMYQGVWFSFNSTHAFAANNGDIRNMEGFK
jgi:hypothetical protein